MTIAAISTGSLAQYVTDSSNLSQNQKAWQTLDQSLAGGNLSAALTAFNSLQTMNQNLSAISGTKSNSQLTADMTALGTALSAGDLSTAQQALGTVQNDMKSTPSQAMQAANAAMAQTVQWVNDILDIPNSSSSSSSDPTAGLLSSASSQDSSLTSTDPATQALTSAYGAASSNLNVFA